MVLDLHEQVSIKDDGLCEKKVLPLTYTSSFTLEIGFGEELVKMKSHLPVQLICVDMTIEPVGCTSRTYIKKKKKKSNAI